MAKAMVLGCWNLRGIVNPLRTTLVVAGVDYTDGRLDSIEASHEYRDGALAATGVVAFPSIPDFVVDEDIHFGCGGHVDAERLAAAIALEAETDLRAAHVKTAETDLTAAYVKTAKAGCMETVRQQQFVGTVHTHLGCLETFWGDKECLR
ncbi:hypothetical protein MMPV_005838 [Pyropia vietnamensis]